MKGSSVQNHKIFKISKFFEYMYKYKGESSDVLLIKNFVYNNI